MTGGLRAVLVATLVLALTWATVEGMTATTRLRYRTEQRSVLHHGLIAAQNDTLAGMNAAMAARYDPEAAVAPIARAMSACGDAAPATALCRGTMNETITWHDPGAAVGAAGDAAIESNVNRSRDAAGNLTEVFAYFDIRLELLNVDGRTIAVRKGIQRLRIVNHPPSFATLDGFTDLSAGGQAVAGVGGFGGRCPTSDPRCSRRALDNNANSAQVAADEGRVFSRKICVDGAAGQGAHAGNLCAATGNPTAAPTDASAFVDRTVTNGTAAANGWSR